MAIIGKGVSKKIAYKKETAWGEIPSASGAKYLRRVTADFNLERESYESNEIRTDYQSADHRLGLRSVTGSLSGELSAGSYSDFMAAVVAKDFASVTALSGLSVTIAASGTMLFTVTRAAGDWLADNVRVGQVISLTGAGLAPANADNNLLVVNATALVLTVKVLSATNLVAEGPIASVGVTVRTKMTEVPLTNHTDPSFTFEQWFSDISVSEVFVGNKVGSVAVTIPTTGLVTLDVSFMGKDLAQGGAVQYFTSPTASNTNGIASSVSGVVTIDGQPVGLITNMDFTINRNMEAANVIASNTAADMFAGRITIAGNMSVYFINQTFQNYLSNESEIAITVSLTASNDKAADCVTFTMPRVKVTSATKADAELGLVQSCSFVGLLNSNTATGLPATTVQIGDTAA